MAYTASPPPRLPVTMGGPHLREKIRQARRPMVPSQRNPRLDHRWHKLHNISTRQESGQNENKTTTPSQAPQYVHQRIS